MSSAATSSEIKWSAAEKSGVDHVMGAVLGIAFTAGLFFSIAHVERAHPAPTEPELDEMRAVSIPFDPPPPKPVEREPAPEVSMPFAGLDVGASESPVKIAVVPPDLDALIPSTDAPPAVIVPGFQLHTELRPKIDLQPDFDRVFSQVEVDKRPAVIYRPDPSIPVEVRGAAKFLRMTALVTVDKKGFVSNVRIFKSSGVPAFDNIILESIRAEWEFSPAMKKGHPVRCLVEQAVRVSWESGGSPFEIP